MEAEGGIKRGKETKEGKGKEEGGRGRGRGRERERERERERQRQRPERRKETEQYLKRNGINFSPNDPEHESINARNNIYKT
jgi:hypothetical protein